MSLGMSYKINNVAAKEFLSRLADADTHIMFDDIGGYLDSETALRFSKAEDFQGNPLIPSERALEESGITLVDHGHLRNSYTHNVFSDGKGVEHGSDMVYAAIHHVGGKTGRHHSTDLPARPVMGINDADEVEIGRIVHDFYQRVVSAK